MRSNVFPTWSRSFIEISEFSKFTEAIVELNLKILVSSSLEPFYSNDKYFVTEFSERSQNSHRSSQHLHNQPERSTGTLTNDTHCRRIFKLFHSTVWRGFTCTLSRVWQLLRRQYIDLGTCSMNRLLNLNPKNIITHTRKQKLFFQGKNGKIQPNMNYRID